MRYAIPLLFLLVAPIFAQTPGSCERGVAEGDLDVDGSEVFARVFNEGNLFFGAGTTSGNGYLVPRDTENSPIFSSGLWVGGKVNDELRVAAARYHDWEYWPGPLQNGATLPNPVDCSAFDRILVVSRDDIRHYLRTGDATDDLRDWPASWGAPVLDGDGVEGNYNLSGGDQPAIYGDQMAWWVMNDVGNVHEETGSNPLGIEVQVSAFAVGTGILALRQATYYRYRIVNRNSHFIDSMHVSLYTDLSIGDQSDDWVGSDTTLSLGFGYNGDIDDNVYGIPPAWGLQIVQGPVALPNGLDDDRDGVVDEQDERVGLTAFTYWCNGCTNTATTDPQTKEEYYNHMQGRWKDGTPFTAAGFGFETDGPPTKFVFPGDPVTSQCWSMANDCQGGYVPPNYQRLVVHTGPFSLGPGQSTEVVFALPFAQGSDNLDSVTQLRAAAYSTQAAWDTGVLAPQRVAAEPLPETFQLQVSPPFPNPFTEQTTIRYELPEPMRVRMTVSDALGREVAVLVDGEQQAGSYEVVFNGADLAAGTYVVRFEAAGEERAFTMIKLR
ncbi:MAG: T9SS type A sorting domain-containing protein [Bacteroidetes bacterium]|nr:T9SS type A sorting domain-containing protein [Bacteroidota bacterium]